MNPEAAHSECSFHTRKHFYTKQTHTHLSVLSGSRVARRHRAAQSFPFLRNCLSPGVHLRFFSRDKCSPALHMKSLKLQIQMSNKAQDGEEDTHTSKHTPVHPLLQSSSVLLMPRFIFSISLHFLGALRFSCFFPLFNLHSVSSSHFLFVPVEAQ